jgi:hypothetical protein
MPMNKKEMILQINILSAIAVMHLRSVMHLRAKCPNVPPDYDEGNLAGTNTAAGLLARRLKIASMTFDKPKMALAA